MAVTDRAGQLQQLANQLPVANQQVAQGLQAARQTQLQGVLQQTPATSNITAASQQLGAQSQGQAGNIAINAAQATQHQAQQLGQTALSEEQTKVRQAASEQQVSLNATQEHLSNQLAKINQDAKMKLVDDQMRFKVDESNRALLNQTQLADWAKMNAQSDQDYKNKMQSMSLAYDRNIQMLQMAQKKAAQIAQQGYMEKNQKLNQDTRRTIEEDAKSLQLKIEAQQAKKKGAMQQMQAIGTIGGTVVGGVLGSIVPGAGTAAGAIAGGALGGALGTLAGGLVK